MEDCKLISWNVASLGSLRKAVENNSDKHCEFMSPEGVNLKAKNPPLETYFDLLGGDIIALQEVKIELAKLKSTAGEDGGVKEVAEGGREGGG